MAQAGMVYRRDGRQVRYAGGQVRRSSGQVQARRPARSHSGMLRLTVCVAVLCLFVYIARMAAIANGAKEISRIQTEIEQLVGEGQYLQVKLAARQDLDRVRDEAMGRLGMRYPREGDVRVISLGGYRDEPVVQTAWEATNP